MRTAVLAQELSYPTFDSQETAITDHDHPINHLRDVDACLVLEVADPPAGREEKARQVHEPLAEGLFQSPVGVRAEVAAHLVLGRHQLPAGVGLFAKRGRKEKGGGFVFAGSQSTRAWRENA